VQIIPKIKISSRYRRVSIKILKDDSVLLKVPSKSYVGQAYNFFESNYFKIVKVLERNLSNRPDLSKFCFRFMDGDLLPVFEENLIKLNVNISNKNKVKFNASRNLLEVCLVNENLLNAHLVKFYRKLANEYFLKEVTKVAESIGVKFNNISIKDTSSRWGSCSSKKNLNFSFRLMFAPKKVFEYIVVHEVCHLKEMNHSKRFWHLVESVMPDYRIYDVWLKENGHLLKYYLV
jgi:hypothetical protein